MTDIEIKIMIRQRFKARKRNAIANNIKRRSKALSFNFAVAQAKKFSEGIALGNQEAADFLFIHTANLFGIDKVTFNDRIQWVNDNFKDLIACALDPINNTFWESADKPFQALAACFELLGYSMEGFDYVSRIAVAPDGSCSGLQNLSMALSRYRILREDVRSICLN